MQGSPMCCCMVGALIINILLMLSLWIEGLRHQRCKSPPLWDRMCLCLFLSMQHLFQWYMSLWCSNIFNKNRGDGSLAALESPVLSCWDLLTPCNFNLGAVVLQWFFGLSRAWHHCCPIPAHQMCCAPGDGLSRQTQLCQVLDSYFQLMSFLLQKYVPASLSLKDSNQFLLYSLWFVPLPVFNTFFKPLWYSSFLSLWRSLAFLWATMNSVVLSANVSSLFVLSLGHLWMH